MSQPWSHPFPQEAHFLNWKMIFRNQDLDTRCIHCSWIVTVSRLSYWIERTRKLYVYIYIHSYILYVYIYIYTFIYISVSRCVCVCMHTQNACIQKHLCNCIYFCIFTHTHICAHMDILGLCRIPPFVISNIYPTVWYLAFIIYKYLLICYMDKIVSESLAHTTVRDKFYHLELSICILFFLSSHGLIVASENGVFQNYFSFLFPSVC